MFIYHAVFEPSIREPNHPRQDLGIFATEVLAKRACQDNEPDSDLNWTAHPSRAIAPADPFARDGLFIVTKRPVQ